MDGLGLEAGPTGSVREEVGRSVALCWISGSSWMVLGLKWGGLDFVAELVFFYFFSSSWGSWSEFFDAFGVYFLSLGPGGWSCLAGGSLFFLRGSSDSRLVSLVRDFLGKFLRGGLLIIASFIAAVCQLLHILVL